LGKDRVMAEMLFMEGSRHLSGGDLLKAQECFRKAILLDPDFAEAHANLGMVLDERGMTGEAEHHYRHSISVNPFIARTHMNLGVLLAGRKRFEEAQAEYRQALDLMPDSPEAWTNLGVLQACRKQEREAEQSYRTAIELDPGHRAAYFNLSYLLLRQGRYDEGWQCFERRRWYVNLENSLRCPRWKGEPLGGRTILIGFEAGHGDMIQFCRYAAVLKKKGASRVDIVCHPALRTLFANMDGVNRVLAAEESFESPEWDFWTPPLSIPYHVKTRLDSIPADIPYLRADEGLAEKWSGVLSAVGPPGEVRVGLVFKGNPRFENDVERSLPSLKTLGPLWDAKGVRFISLQKGQGEDEAADPPDGLPLVNLGSRITDFADTAAVVVNLDLIICVDTAVAHLAGALGRDCWVLLPDYKTDWRWLDGRTDSPWYPGVMRLFRQKTMGDWTGVVDEVRLSLKEYAAGHGHV